MAVLVVGTAFLLGVAAVGTVIVLRARAQHPDRWDPRVEEYVAFVERSTGRPFEHPVEVRFLPDDEFEQAVTAESDSGDVDEHDAAEADDTAAAMLRALGVVEGDLDLDATEHQLTGEGTAAFYDTDTQAVIVRGTEVSPDVEGTLVHELTHAWQDQEYDLDRLYEFEDDEEAAGFRALAEGDAVNREDEWVAGLSPDERDDYEAASQEAADASDLEGVPEFLQAQFGAPYALGAPLVALIEADGGRPALDRAFAHPPRSSVNLLDPWTYLDREEPADVPTPEGPVGAEVADTTTFGAVSWYLLLADRIEPRVALTAADAITGDRTVVTRADDGLVCLDANLATDSADGRLALTDALDAWSADLAEVRIGTDGDLLTVSACDPGPDADLHPGNRALASLTLPAVRSYATAARLSSGEDRETASCYGRAFADQLTVDDLSSEGGPSDDRIVELRRAAERSCR